MGAQLRSGLPAADEKTITTLGGKIAIKDNYAVDKTGGSVTASATETVIAQVQIPANSTISHLIIMAAVRFTDRSYSGVFKIKLGTAGTIADTQIGNSCSLSLAGIITGPVVIGGSLLAIAIAPADYDKTVLNYVSITAQNSTNSNNITSTVDTLAVIGV